LAARCADTGISRGSSTNARSPRTSVLLRAERPFALSLWTASAEENTIEEFQQALAEKDVEEWESLSKDELMARVTKVIRDSSAPVVFQDMQMTTDIKAWFDSENSKRSRRKPWSYKHLENGFRGAFFKWTPESPVMSAVDTKRWLAGVKVLVGRS